MTPLIAPSMFALPASLALIVKDWKIEECTIMKSDESEQDRSLIEDSKEGSSIDDTVRLIDRVSNKDADALAILYNANAGLLMAVIMAVLKNKAESEDVLQDAFITIWNKAEMYSSHLGKPTSWMVTIAKNKAYDRYRKLKRQSEGMIVLKDNWGVSNDSVTQGPLTKNEELLARVNDLNMDQRRAIELVFYEGLTQQEAADKLETPLGTVKARIRRGLLKLKQCITKH